jgi:hypothetical protein
MKRKAISDITVNNSFISCRANFKNVLVCEKFVIQALVSLGAMAD